MPLYCKEYLCALDCFLKICFLKTEMMRLKVYRFLEFAMHCQVAFVLDIQCLLFHIIIQSFVFCSSTWEAHLHDWTKLPWSLASGWVQPIGSIDRIKGGKRDKLGYYCSQILPGPQIGSGCICLPTVISLVRQPLSYS